MSPDNRKKTTQEGRRQLLEEIRRRAEEAELRRIEEEETELAGRPPRSPGRPAPTVPPAQPPAPGPNEPPSSGESTTSLTDPAAALPPVLPPAAPEPEPAPAPAAAPEPPAEFTSGSMEQFVERVATLRDEFYNALELGDLAAARTYLDDLAGLTPEDAGLDGMRDRLAALEATSSRQALTPEPAPEPPSAFFSLEPPGVDHAEVKRLLEKADALYQREQYGDALGVLGTVLADDPGNEDAVRLRELVERSRNLSEKVAEEDARVHELADRAAAAPPPPVEPEEPDVPDSLAGSVEQEGPMAPPKPPLASRARPLLRTAALLLLVCAVAVGGYIVFTKLKATVAPAQRAVLVLPPAPGTGDPQADQLVDGLKDDITRRLAAITDFRIVAPSSGVRPVAFSPAQTARTAGTGMFLRWNASSSGSMLALEGVLLDTAGSTVQWTKKYTVNVRDLAATRPLILEDLVAAMGVRPTDEEEAVLRAPPTASGDAYLAYLRGRALMQQSGTSSALLTVQLFESALQTDPAFAQARAALGWAHLLAWESGDTAAAHLTAALSCSEQALGTGVKIAEAWRTRGAVEQAQGRYDRAIEGFLQALAIAPSDPDARRRLATALIIHGQPDKALAAAQRSVRDDPSNPESYTTLGLVQQLMAVLGGDSKDDYVAVLKTFKTGERLSPDPGAYASRYLANVHLYAQQPDEALSILMNDIAQDPENFESLYRLGRVQQTAGRPITEWQPVLVGARKVLEKRLAAAPGDPVLLGWLALVQTRLGAFKEAQSALAQALDSKAANAAVLYNAARVHALQQDLKGSVEFLQKAVEQHYDLAAVLDVDFFNLHGNPDFQRSVTR